MILDILLGLIVLVNFGLGLGYGAVRRFLGFFGLFVGCAAATALAPSLARAIGTIKGDLGPVSLMVIAFFLTLGVMLFAFEFLGGVYYRLVRLFSVMAFDHVAGAAAGVVLSLFEAAVVIRVLAAGAGPRVAGATPNESYAMHDALGGSVLVHFLGAFIPAADRFLSVVLPGDMAAFIGQLSR